MKVKLFNCKIFGEGVYQVCPNKVVMLSNWCASITVPGVGIHFAASWAARAQQSSLIFEEAARMTEQAERNTGAEQRKRKRPQKQHDPHTKLCRVCGENVAKYKCPVCLLP